MVYELKNEQHRKSTINSLQQKLKKKKKGTGLPWWLSGYESPASAGDMGSIPDPGRFHVLWSN